jgi:hypothetical protein
MRGVLIPVALMVLTTMTLPVSTVWAHKGPHDDFTAPAFKQTDQLGYGSLSLSRVGGNIMVQTSFPVENFGVDSDKKADLDKLKARLADVNQLIKAPDDCKPGINRVRIYDRHRSTRKDIKKLKEKKQKQYIEAFAQVTTLHKLVCPKKSKEISVTIQVFEHVPKLKELQLKVKQGKKRLEETVSKTKTVQL